MTTRTYYAHGKLMLTGEYLVLDGAKSIAIPTKFGQKLAITELEEASKQIEWRAYNSENELWLSTYFPLPNSIIKSKEHQSLLNILKAIDELNPDVFTNKKFDIKTYLEFPNEWGLGSSSTLISLLSQWADINPFILLSKTFGGSGYDIACANADSPISYKIIDQETREIKPININKDWTKNAYFIYLGNKMNSREAIAHYQELENKKKTAKRINYLSEKLLEINTTKEAIDLFVEHEAIMQNFLEIKNVQTKYFNDFNGVCKSLGAWGGDFILAISNDSEEEVKTYFKNKQLNTFFRFNDLIWKS